MRRNIFESRKYVEEYRTDDVERELGMDRQKLIQLGLLLGSDYSEGVAGVGIVNAIEIVHAFQPVGGLSAFRQWVLTPDAELVAAAQALHGTASNAPAGNPSAGRKRLHRPITCCYASMHQIPMLSMQS